MSWTKAFYDEHECYLERVCYGSGETNTWVYLVRGDRWDLIGGPWTSNPTKDEVLQRIRQFLTGEQNV